MTGRPADAYVDEPDLPPVAYVPPPCSYDRHRGLDWCLVGSRVVVCGVCHSPVPSLNVVWLDRRPS